MNQPVLELFGHSTVSSHCQWAAIVAGQQCPFLGKKCIKIRKSQPNVSIGTCTVSHGRNKSPIVICPHRLLQHRKVFRDAIHLLSLHEPGNDIHVVSEVSIPGGSLDYMLVSAKRGKPRDFVGIELQTMDTTGSIWPSREKWLAAMGLPHDQEAASSSKLFGMNWKMTAKTILVQLHHKVETFEHLSKHLVLVLQDHLLTYMRGEFLFDHLSHPLVGHAMHFHAYEISPSGEDWTLQLAERTSTDSAGIATALGRQASANVEIEDILKQLEKKLSPANLWSPTS